MLRFYKAIYLYFLLKSILSVRLRNRLWGSDILLFSEFTNIIFNFCIIPLLNSLYFYILFSNLFCSIQRIYYLSDFI